MKCNSSDSDSPDDLLITHNCTIKVIHFKININIML